MVFCCLFCCVFECLEAIYVALRMFSFQKLLHLKFKSQLSAGYLFQLCLFIRPLAGSFTAYSSNQKLSCSKSPEGFCSSWWEERGLKQWANPSCFRLALTTESVFASDSSHILCGFTCLLWLRTLVLPCSFLCLGWQHLARMRTQA